MAKYFNEEKELACKDGCKTMPSQKSIDMLDNLRDKINEPIIVICGARCIKHNKEIGGTLNSKHIPIKDSEIGAFDIKKKNPIYDAKLVLSAWEIGFTLVEVCDKHIHIDNRPGEKMILWGQSV